MKINFVIKFVISITLLVYLLYDANLNEIYKSISSANHKILAFVFLLHFIGLSISAFRWQILLKAQKVKTNFGLLFKSYLISTFFNHFMPSTVGGDSVRTYDSWKLSQDKEKAFAVVILDRFMGLFTLLVFALISMLFSPDLGNKIPDLGLWVFLLFLGAIIIIWFIFSPPLIFFEKLQHNKNKIISNIASFIYKIDVAFSQFSNKKEKLIYSLILSVFLQLNVVIYYYLISYSFGFNILFIDFFIIVPLTIFITMIPISINGVGLREGALFLFLSQYGFTKANAIAFAWIDYGMLLALGMIGGITYLLRK